MLERLGIGNHFEDVFDIIAAELEPKPARQTYMKFLKLHGVDPSRAAMFEDLARNLVTPHDLGMTTVLVVPDGTKNVVREDWELEGRDAAEKIATPPWQEITEGIEPGHRNLRAAVGQLFGAVAQSAHTASPEQQQRIVDIVNNARREIYQILGESE